MNGYPKIWHVGSPEVRDTLFRSGVEITEKIDGSQIGFGLDSEGGLLIRSKGAFIFKGDTYVRQPDSLFKGAVDYIISIKDRLHKETWYYGEVLSAPHHNTLTYGRIPRNYVALYGIITKGFWCDDHAILTQEADKLGFDSVPLIYQGLITSVKQFDEFMERESYYGGTKIEGIVIKNYKDAASSAYSSQCFAKFVSEKFKEMNGANWSAKTSKIEDFYTSLTSEARWEKAIQHLRDDGNLTESPKDIGPLIEHILTDFETEQKEYIKEQLYRLHIRQCKQFATKGFPEFYKKRLAASSIVGVEPVLVDTAAVGPFGLVEG